MAATAAFKKIIQEKGPKVLETSFAKDLCNGSLSPRRLGRPTLYNVQVYDPFCSERLNMYRAYNYRKKYIFEIKYSIV